MSYSGTLEKTADAAIEQAKADVASREVGGFAIMKEVEEDGFFYLPIAPDTKLSTTEESQLVGRYEWTGKEWNEKLLERAMGESP